jgi:hypothetical protein
MREAARRGDTLPRRFMRILFHCRLSCNTAAANHVGEGEDYDVVVGHGRNGAGWAKLVLYPCGDLKVSPG